MCSQTNYSKYQKRVIKFLTNHLGAHTPFTYEKTQTNHLKVLIDGVTKPIYTGSTPSDFKSINNFMAEVKRELKASHVNSIKENTLPNIPKMAFTNPAYLSYEKLIKNCVKSLRIRINSIKTKEQEKVLEDQSVDIVSDYRNDVVKHAISVAIKARKHGPYIKSQEMKNIEKKVTENLAFMMPTLAYYSELLEEKSIPKEDVSEVVVHEKEAVVQEKPLISNAVKLEESIKAKPLENKAKTIVEKQPEASMDNKKSPTASHNNSTSTDSATELMSMSVNNRVSLLQKLSKTQALQLIEDVNKAMSLNLEQDILAVVALIKEKDIPLDDIISRMKTA